MSLKAFVPSTVSALASTGCSGANQSNPMDEIGRAVSCSYPSGGKSARPANPSGGEDVLSAGETKVTLHLTASSVEITMDRSATPRTINSFMSLARQGRFDETRYHRLTDYDILVLQCGDPTGAGEDGPGYTIPDRLGPRTIGLEKEGSVATCPKGTVAIANAGRPNTAGSQFFIVWEDSQLSPDYAVFGTVDEDGLVVVQGIVAQGVDEADGMGPITEAIISSVTLSWRRRTRSGARCRWA